MENNSTSTQQIFSTNDIPELLAANRIKEKESTNQGVPACMSCYFNRSCQVSKTLPCMGHNRPDRKSIYYAGVK